MKPIIERTGIQQQEQWKDIPPSKLEQKCQVDEAKKDQKLFNYKAELSCLLAKNQGKALHICRAPFLLHIWASHSLGSLKAFRRSLY